MWEWCNHGEPSDPRFKECNYQRLQVFIPYEVFGSGASSAEWCPARKLFWDRWSWTGIFKQYLNPKASDPELRQAAISRWQKGKEIDVSEAKWCEMSAGLPKLCYRHVSLDGVPLGVGGRSQWHELGVIGAVWCDY
jgi:hypothetical protein